MEWDTAFLNSLSPPFANPTNCTLFYKLLVYIQRISNQTFNQLLLKEHQSLTTGPEAYDTPNYALTMKIKLVPMDFSTLIQQKVV